MDQSTNLQLPYLAPAQAQKHVTVNEVIRRLDGLVQLTAASASTTAQPASPADGSLYILPAGKTGTAWGGMSNNALAYFVDGAWEQITPRIGWLAYVRDSSRFLVFNGTTWTALIPEGPNTRPFTQTIGLTGALATDGASVASANSSYGWVDAVQADGAITQVRVVASAAGTLGLRRWRRSGVTLTQVGSDTALTVAQGSNILTTNIPVLAGDVLSLVTNAQTSFRFKAGTTAPAWFGEASMGAPYISARLDFGFTIEASVPLGSVLQKLRHEAVTFTAADCGCQLVHGETSARTWTIPAQATVAIPLGAPPIVVVNEPNAGVLTIAPASGVTLLRGDGTAGSGNRTVPAHSLATLLKIGPDTWMITGAFA